MFLSVSLHSSELSIANHSSRPTVSQLKCVFDTILLYYNRQKSPPSFWYASFNSLHANSNQMTLVWLQPQVFRGYFFNSCNFRGNVKAFRPTGLLRWQKLTDARVRFDSGAIFSTNHNSLLRIVTNAIASFCIDHRLRQITFFVFAKVGKGWLSRHVEIFWNKKKSFII